MTKKEPLDLAKYSPLVKSILKRYLGKGVEYDDLYQLGCLGLVKAWNKFDESRGVKFVTYAVPLVAGEIKRFLRDDGQIKVSRSVKSLYVKIKNYLALCQNNERQPTVDDLAREFNVSREEIVNALEASHYPISLTETNNDDSVALIDRLPISENANFFADDAMLVNRIVIENILKNLDEKEQKVILLRYFRNCTQSEVARELNISQVQVSRIEQRVLEHFRLEFEIAEND